MIILLTVDTQIRVRYEETDCMGVVHHSNYYIWFEVGRTEYMRSQGISYLNMEERGFMLPLSETYCKYLEGARYDDVLIVRTSMPTFTGARLTMGYEIIRKLDNRLLAKGKTVHGVTDRNLRPINIKRADPELYDLFYRCAHEEEEPAKK